MIREVWECSVDISVTFQKYVIYYYVLVKTVALLLTGAAAAPANVEAMVINSTSITVQWKRLSPCRDINGIITMYKIEYQAQPSDTKCKNSAVDFKNLTTMVPGVFNNGGETTLSGLMAYTTYSIQVAAVNEQGDVGVFSEPVTPTTSEDSEAN